ncbi:MAG: type II toxin-antitoxin system HipA family toxin [bacterium]|nr:type II toxin-antitoxin system HipA family toxin [bacterium]
MISEARRRPPQAFVWIWLPGAGDPVVAARLTDRGSRMSFVYGQSYLARHDAIALSLPDLPLQEDEVLTRDDVPGCIADAGPDSWGRRVIERRLGLEHGGLSSLGYLLESASNRIGALDLQHDADAYAPRCGDEANIEDLAEAAQRVEQGLPLRDVLRRALLQSTSAGGARPKALITGVQFGFLAKFSSVRDSDPAIQGEHVAMLLAREAGIEVASVSLQRVAGRQVLLVERFDRTPGDGRRLVVSARTLLQNRAAEEPGGTAEDSYPRLAEEIRARFAEPTRTMRELFARITFSILCGNTDDHAKNHAAFWDGRSLTLTPAFDICPQVGFGVGAEQAMAFGNNGDRASQVARCVDHAHTYRLAGEEAAALVDHQIDTIRANWHTVCDRSELTRAERSALWGRQFLNPYTLIGHVPNPHLVAQPPSDPLSRSRS